MSAVIERRLDLKSVQSAWKELTKLVPLSHITGNKDYERRLRVMDEFVERIGSDESHPLMPLLDLLAKQIEAYEEEHHHLPDATPAEVLQYLMEEHHLTQTDLAEELGGQSVVSAILNGKRELNTRQAKALAARFNVSPAVFL
jgi:HTH-type transcriptional regulator / antitoxin HigA